MKTLHITPGSPWENGYCESFNGSMRDDLVNGEIFYTLAEAQHGAPPWLPSGSALLQLRPAMVPEAIMH